MSQTEMKETLQKIGSELKSYQDKNDELEKAIKEGKETRAEELKQELKKRDDEIEKLHDRYDELEVSMKKNNKGGDTDEIPGLEAEHKTLDSFLRDQYDQERSFKAYEQELWNASAKEARPGVPKELKSLAEQNFKSSIGFSIDELPDNLKAYGRSIKKKALSTDSNADGGIFSLPNFEMSVVKGIREQSPVRQVARVITIGSGDSLEIPVRDTTISSQNAGERENVSNTGTPTYKMVRIQTHERSASPALTRQMIEDAFLDIVAEVQRDGQEEFAVQEGNQFISGSGVDEAEGILTNGDISSTDSGSGTAFDFDDLIDLQTALKQGYQGTFMFSRQTRGYIRKLKDANNNYLWSPNVAADAPNTLLGDPYLLATDLASPASGNFSANDVPVLYGDFQRGYYIVDRLGLDVLRDPYSNRPFIEIYMRRRYGGQVVLPEAIKKLTTTT